MPTVREELGISTHAFGEAGVLAVGLELIKRGFLVLKPFVDDHGVDLGVVKGGKFARIQVKTASLNHKLKSGREKTSPHYEFILTGLRARFDGPPIIKVKTFSDEVDFVVLVGLYESRYWVVPAGFLDGRKHLTISTSQRSRTDIDWEDIRKRRETGESFKSLGNSIGLSAPAVLERLRGSTKASGSVVNEIRSYEDKWELIGQFLEQ